MQPYAVRLTAQMLAVLKRRRVFLSHSGAPRWAEGEIIVLRRDCAIEPYAQFYVGNWLPRAMGCFSYSHSAFTQMIGVGRYCSIARDVAWMGASHPMEWASTSPFFYDPEVAAARSFRALHDPEPPALPEWPGAESRETQIGHDVWIGEGAMIGRGVTIGDGAVIGARTLVLKDVPPYAIVVGHPARVLRMRFPEPLVERFLALKWWRYAPNALSRLAVTEPERFLDELEDLISRREIREIRPAPMKGSELLDLPPPGA